MAADRNDLLAKAARFRQERAYDKALRVYTDLLKQEPRNERILLKLGELQQIRGDLPGAVAAFRQVADIHANDGFFLKAVAVLKQIVRLVPDDIPSHESLSMLYQQLGLLNDALAHLQALARLLGQARRDAERHAVLERIAELAPESRPSPAPPPKESAGQAATPRQAEADLLHGRASPPASSSEREQAAPPLAPITAGTAQARNGSFSFLPRSTRSGLSEEDREDLLALVDQHEGRRELGIAGELLQAAVGRNPTDFQLLARFGHLLMGLGRSDQAAAVFVKLAQALHLEGHASMAIPVQELALKLKDSQLLRAEHAEMLRSAGRQAEARAAYKELALQLRQADQVAKLGSTWEERNGADVPSKVGSRCIMAEVHWHLGNQAEAHRLLMEAEALATALSLADLRRSTRARRYELFPADEDAAVDAAAVRLSSGDAAGAFSIVLPLAAISDDWEACWLLSLALEQLGRLSECHRLLLRLARLAVRTGRPDATEVVLRAQRLGQLEPDLSALLARPAIQELDHAGVLSEATAEQSGPSDAAVPTALDGPGPSGHPSDIEVQAENPATPPSSAAGISSTRLIDRLIEDRMPQPIARQWRLVAQFDQPAMLLLHLKTTLSVTLRVLLGMVIPDLVQGAEASELQRVGEATRASDRRRHAMPEAGEHPHSGTQTLLQDLRGLDRPSDGNLKALLFAAARLLDERSAPRAFMPELRTWLFHSDGRPTRDALRLERLIELRNRLHHEMVPRDAQRLATEMLPAMRHLLQSLQWVGGYRLVRATAQRTGRRGVKEARLHVFAGHEDPPRPIRTSYSADLIDGSVYLLNPQAEEALEVSPFFQVLLHDRIPAEKMFVWESVDLRGRLRLRQDETGLATKVAFSSCGSGATISDWYGQGKSLRLRQEFAEHSGALESRSGGGADIGRTLAGRFEVKGLLGLGGMASVYQAFDLNRSTEIALKVIKPELIDDGEFVQRFQREIETMRLARHAGVMPIEDYGQLPDGRHFIAMPVFAAGSLSGLLGAKTELPALVRWAVQALEALDYLHDNGIVHRDIKPSNLMLGDGKLVIADFGIARSDSNEWTLTGTQEQLGSEGFMSPEASTRGEEVSYPTDIYSLAVVLDMLTIGSRTPRHAPGKGIHGRWGQLLVDMASRDPDARPSANEALTRLKQEVEPEVSAQALDEEP